MTYHTKDKKTIKSNYFRFHKNLYAIKMISKTSVIWFCFDCRSRQLCQRHSSGIWSTLPIMLSCVYWANGQLDIIIRQINESMQYGVILKTCMNIWLELKPWNTINSILVKVFFKKKPFCVTWMKSGLRLSTTTLNCSFQSGLRLRFT